MNRIFPAALCLLTSACLAACGGHPQTIELQLEKQAFVVCPMFSAPRILRDTADNFACLYPRAAGLPDGWEAYVATTDFPQALYQGFCGGMIDTAAYMHYFTAWQRDTAAYSREYVRVFLMAAFGRDGAGAEHVMFDTDGDGDFSDETDYLLGQQPLLVKMAYERVMDKKPVPDVTWVEISDRFGQRSLVMREMTQGAFKLGNTEYTCTAVYNSSYDKQGCSIRIADNKTITECGLKDYVRLGDTWYLLDSLSPDGRFLRMVLTPDAENRESMQVGFRPYSFTATDMAGRTVRFPDDFAGKYVLLDFWALSCGPCVHEIRNLYLDVYARFKDSGFEIVGVADNTAADLRGFMAENAMPWVVIADRDNGKVREKPYGISSFPTLFLLGPDGRILEHGIGLRGDGLEFALRRYMPGAPAKGAD